MDVSKHSEQEHPTHEGRSGVSDNVDALDGLVKSALSGNILNNRPLELALLELAGMLFLPRGRLVLRADSTANAAQLRGVPEEKRFVWSARASRRGVAGFWTLELTGSPFAGIGE